MSDVLYKYNRNVNFFLAPQTLFNNGVLATCTASEQALYMLLWFWSQKHTTIVPKLTVGEITKLNGMSAGTIQKAREGLVSKGIISVEQVRSVDGIAYKHLMLDATGAPLQGPRSRTRKKLGALRFRRSVYKLNSAELIKFWEHHFPELEFSNNRDQEYTLCPFHGDTRPSFSLNRKTSLWKCHTVSCAGYEGGNHVQFERRISKCSELQAIRHIAKITGAVDILPSQAGKRYPEARYDYVHEDGELLYWTERYDVEEYGDPKFRAFRPKPDGGRFANLKGTRRILYHLPEVIAASVVIVCEGEKDADNVAALGLVDLAGKPVAVTTNIFGAGKWRPEYSEFLLGKKVLIFGDNDIPGSDHAFDVKESVSPYASEVKLVFFSAGIDGFDVSDFLVDHTPEQLIERAGDWIELSPEVQI
jgi:hypothetical protein